MTLLCSMIEALLFISGEPLAAGEIADATERTQIEIAAALDELSGHYEKHGSGLRLSFVNGGAYLCTDKAHAGVITRLLQPVQQRAFSQAMMETLSVVAYKQPVTRAEIEAVRGVRCEYAVRELISMGMVQEIGRKDTIGRPALLGTTDAFLRHFGLGSIRELPERELFGSGGLADTASAAAPEADAIEATAENAAEAIEANIANNLEDDA